MNEAHTYSDEYISAYIDGELDSEERAHLLFDEQTDKELAQRINETRMLKEKIQLVYSGVKSNKDEKKSFSCTVFVNRHRALAASLLLFSIVTAMLTYNMGSNANLVLAKQLIRNTQAISASAISDAIGNNKHVVINVSQYHPKNFSETINNIEALLQKKDGSPFSVEIVANGQGLKALDKESSVHASKINQLANRFDNLEVVACAKSMAKLATEGDPIQLMKSIMITPSAAEQVAKRTSAGWLYIKI
jgi:intracellular sulfur oxidation DsrE/DsrF family protein